MSAPAVRAGQDPPEVVADARPHGLTFSARSDEEADRQAHHAGRGSHRGGLAASGRRRGPGDRIRSRPGHATRADARRPRPRALVRADLRRRAGELRKLRRPGRDNANGSPLASASPPATAYGPTQFHTAYGLPTTASGTPTSRSSTPTTTRTSPAISPPTTRLRPREPRALPGASPWFRKVNESGGRAPRRRTRAGRWRSRSTSRRPRDLPELQRHPRRGQLELVLRPRAAENEAVALDATVISNSWGGGEFSGETHTQPLLQPPGRRRSSSPPATAATGSTSRRLAGCDRGRRNVPEPRGELELRERDRLVRRRLRLLAIEPKPSWQQTPAVPSGRSPTSRPTPTRTPGPRSTTPTRLRPAAGSRWAARACRRRSSGRLHAGRGAGRELRLDALSQSGCAARRHVRKRRRL